MDEIVPLLKIAPPSVPAEQSVNTELVMDETVPLLKIAPPLFDEQFVNVRLSNVTLPEETEKIGKPLFVPSMMVFAAVPPYDVLARIVIGLEIEIPLWKYVPGFRMMVSPLVALFTTAWIGFPGLMVIGAAVTGAANARSAINSNAKTVPLVYLFFSGPGITESSRG